MRNNTINHKSMYIITRVNKQLEALYISSERTNLYTLFELKRAIDIGTPVIVVNEVEEITQLGLYEYVKVIK